MLTDKQAQTKKEADFKELIDSKLDIIALKSREEAPAILQQMRNELEIISKPAEEQSEVTLLADLKDIYDNADSYAFPEDVALLKKIIIERIYRFIVLMQRESPKTLQAYIKEQKKIADAKRLASAKVLPTFSNNTLSKQDLENLRQYDLHRSTKKPEADLVLAAISLIKKINAWELQYQLYLKKLQEDGFDPDSSEAEAMRDRLLSISRLYIDILVNHLGLPKEASEQLLSEGGISIEELNDIRLRLNNMIFMMEKSKVTVAGFKSFSADVQDYLLRDPGAAIQIFHTTSKDDLNFCIESLRLQDKISWILKTKMTQAQKARETSALIADATKIFELNLGWEIGEEDFSLDRWLLLLENAQQLFANDLFELQKFMKFPEHLRTSLIEDPSVAISLIKSFGLSEMNLIWRDYELLKKLNCKKVELLCKEGEIDLDSLLLLSDENLHSVIDNPQILLDFVKATGINLKTLFGLENAKIELLFADLGNLSRVSVAINYYFLSKAAFLAINVDALEVLLANPCLANNSRFKPNDYQVEVLRDVIDANCKEMLEYLHALHKDKYLNNITKFKQAPFMLVAKLQNAGLHSQPLLYAIYRATLTLNMRFVNNYLGRFYSKNVYTPENFEYESLGIDSLFDPASSKVINEVLARYIESLTGVQKDFYLQNYECNAKNSEESFPHIFAAVTDLRLQFAGNFEMAEVIAKIEAINLHIYDLYSNLSDGYFSEKHLSLLNYLLKSCLHDDLAKHMGKHSKLAKRQDKYVKLLRFAIGKSKQYEQLPANYITKFCSVGESALFKAIHEGDYTAVVNEISNGADFMTYNNKGVSCYTLALDSEDYRIRRLIRYLVQNKTKNALTEFLNAEGFIINDLTAHNAKGETPMSLAIKTRRFNIVQGLLARDIDITVTDVWGKTAAQTALKYAANNILSDLSTYIVIKEQQVRATSNTGVRVSY